MKMWRWSNAATSLIAFDSSMPLPNTSPDMSPHAGDRDRVGLNVDAHFEEMALDGNPRALGGDAHRLVVVAVASRRWRRRRRARSCAPARCALATSEKVAVPLSAATTK